MKNEIFKLEMHRNSNELLCEFWTSSIESASAWFEEESSAATVDFKAVDAAFNSLFSEEV